MSNNFDKKIEKNNCTQAHEILTLDSAKPHETYIVVGCALSAERKIRFCEMGLTTGAQVKVLKRAPLGCPLEIEVRGYLLCIRNKDAKCFSVQKKR